MMASSEWYLYFHSRPVSDGLSQQPHPVKGNIRRIAVAVAQIQDEQRGGGEHRDLPDDHAVPGTAVVVQGLLIEQLGLVCRVTPIGAHLAGRVVPAAQVQQLLPAAVGRVVFVRREQGESHRRRGAEPLAIVHDGPRPVVRRARRGSERILRDEARRTRRGARERRADQDAGPHRSASTVPPPETRNSWPWYSSGGSSIGARRCNRQRTAPFAPLTSSTSPESPATSTPPATGVGPAVEGTASATRRAASGASSGTYQRVPPPVRTTAVSDCSATAPYTTSSTERSHDTASVGSDTPSRWPAVVASTSRRPSQAEAERTVPGVAIWARTAPVVASSRNRESPIVATTMPSAVGTGVARAARPSARFQRWLPLAAARARTSPASVTAMTRESASASGAVTPAVRTVHRALPVRRSSAYTRPSGTAWVATNTRVPAISGPPATVPRTLRRHSRCPDARSSSTTARSDVPTATTDVPIATAPRTDLPALVRHCGWGSAARVSATETSWRAEPRYTGQPRASDSGPKRATGTQAIALTAHTAATSMARLCRKPNASKHSARSPARP